jgi:transcriptional regulator with XRE-family HTH domain
MEDSLASRVRLGLLALGLQMKDLREELGVSKQVLSNVINGERQESKHHAAIAKTLKCAEGWLVTGDGTAPAWYTNPSGETRNASTRDARELTDEERLRRAEVMVEALLARIEGLADENATLRAQLEGLEARGRRSKRKAR